MTELETAWLAGLLEGEGCFREGTSSRGGRNNGCVISLTMKDKDVVEHAAVLVKGKLYFDKARKINWSDQWRFQLCGDAAVTTMEAILPFMGNRRSAKIRELLARAARRLSTDERCRKSRQALGEVRRDHRTLFLEFE